MADANDGTVCIFGANEEGTRSVSMFNTCCETWCGGEYGTAYVGDGVETTSLYSQARYRAGCVSKTEGMMALPTGMAEEEEEQDVTSTPPV